MTKKVERQALVTISVEASKGGNTAAETSVTV